ncbi:MAG: threonylcarbamoyl-AMP synthase [Oscillochloris sp.]|nr:threonylcarbamoyl-AMP synthase [Oscillochloris sp.]
MAATRILAADEPSLAVAAALLRAGELVAFPTETVYGLGGDALNPHAVARIFAAKGRPAEDPLIIHLAAAADLDLVTRDPPPALAMLADHFWPGPLTLVLPQQPGRAACRKRGRETVAVRVPGLPLARRLIAAAGTPIAAPSANRFGHTSPTSAAHVLADLDGRIAAVIDGGATNVGLESTVLDLTSTPPTLLRPGGVSLEQLQALLGEVALGAKVAPGGGQIAPGLLERHYAPEHPLRLVIGPVDAARAWLRGEAEQLLAAGLRVGLLIPDEDAAFFADRTYDLELLGPAAQPELVAQRLYAALRALDARRPDRILARDIGIAGIARAVADRLRRAAAGDVTELG